MSLGFGVGLYLGLGMALGTGTEARAAKMNAAMTNAPLKYPTYLNGNGKVLSGSSSTHALAAKDKSKAAYVAFKLEDGAAVSRSIPMMRTRSPVGSDARQAIASVTSGVGSIAVRTQKGLFLVNSYRPKLAIPKHKVAVNHKGAAGNRKVSTSHIAVKAKTQKMAKNTAKTAAQHITGAKASTAKAGGSKSVQSVKTALNPKTAQSKPEASPLHNLLKLNSPQPTATTHSDTGEALPPALQVTTSSPAITAAMSLAPSVVLETPVPEPGTLAFAGLVIAGAVAREGLRRRKSARHA